MIAFEMKDPIKEHKRQEQKLNEIFGWLSRTFGSKPETTPASFLDAMKRYRETETDVDCSKMDVGKKLNTKVAGALGRSEVTIGKNTIKNIKGLRFELLDNRGKGTGKYDYAVVKDFKCYDLNKDIYGIKWLFDDNASYAAESLSGDLKAGVKNQSVTFMGVWNAGKFYGNFMSGQDKWKGGTPERGSSFAFFAPGLTKKTTGKTKKRKSRKISAPTPATPTPSGVTTPMSVASVTPTKTPATPTPSGATTPMSVASVTPTKTTPTPSATAGTASKSTKKGAGKKPFKLPESFSVERPTTIKEFFKGIL